LEDPPFVSLMIGATFRALLLIHLPIYAPLLPLIITAGLVAMAAKSLAFHDGPRRD